MLEGVWTRARRVPMAKAFLYPGAPHALGRSAGFSHRKALNGQPVRLALRRGSPGRDPTFPGREPIHASPGVGEACPSLVQRVRPSRGAILGLRRCADGDGGATFFKTPLGGVHWVGGLGGATTGPSRLTWCDHRTDFSRTLYDGLSVVPTMSKSGSVDNVGWRLRE